MSASDKRSKKHTGGRRGPLDRPWPAGLSPIRDAGAKIDIAQPHAAKTLIEALTATRLDSIRVGESEYKTVQVPDWAVRVKAASALLNKRLPDMARIEHTGADGSKLEIKITDYTRTSAIESHTNGHAIEATATAEDVGPPIPLN